MGHLCQSIYIQVNNLDSSGWLKRNTLYKSMHAILRFTVVMLPHCCTHLCANTDSTPASRFSTSAVQTSNTHGLLTGSQEYPMTYAVVALGNGKIKLRCYTILWMLSFTLQVNASDVEGVGNSHLVCNPFLLTRSGCCPFCNILKKFRIADPHAPWRLLENQQSNSPPGLFCDISAMIKTWQIYRWAGPIGHPSVYVKRLLKSDPTERNGSIRSIHKPDPQRSRRDSPQTYAEHQEPWPVQSNHPLKVPNPPVETARLVRMNRAPQRCLGHRPTNLQAINDYQWLMTYLPLKLQLKWYKILWAHRVHPYHTSKDTHTHTLHGWKKVEPPTSTTSTLHLCMVAF